MRIGVWRRVTHLCRCSIEFDVIDLDDLTELFADLAEVTLEIIRVALVDLDGNRGKHQDGCHGDRSFLDRRFEREAECADLRD